MYLVKNFRLIILLILLSVSFYFIFSIKFVEKAGVVVEDILENSGCSNLREGDVITKILDQPIKNVENFKMVEKSLKKEQYATMIVNGVPSGCVAVEDGHLGLEVKNIPSKKLNFALDIQGGVTTFLRAKENITENELNSIVKTINKRVELLKQPETYVSVFDDVIKISSLDGNVDPLIKKCELKTKIEQKLEVRNGTTEIKIGYESYPLKFTNNTFEINNSTYEINESFYLEDIGFRFENITNTSATLLADVFTNDDIVNILSRYGYVRYDSKSRTYVFNIPIEISFTASERFKKITKGVGSTIIGGQAVLNANLVFYLDDNLISRLNIPYQFVLQELRTISIIGFRESSIEAQNSKLEVEACLQSGELPIGLEIVKTEVLEPKLKNSIWNGMLLFVTFLSISALTLFYVKYKNLKIGVYSLAISLSEGIIVFGVLAFLQTSIIRNLIIDIFSIIGLSLVIILTLVKVVFATKKMVFGKKISWSIIFVGFLLLFSPWKNLGLILLIDAIIATVITIPVLRNLL
jgi:hypothetical protein